MSVTPSEPHTDAAATDAASGRCPLRGQAVPLYHEKGGSAPDATWERLRERHGRLAPVEYEPGITMWLVLGYQENLEVLRNPHLYSRDVHVWREVREGRFDPYTDHPILNWRNNPMHKDGEEHQRLRAPVVDGLTRVHEPDLIADIQEIADNLIDGFIADGKGDLITQYATPLPVLVLNRLFGLDDAYGYMLGDLNLRVWENGSQTEEALEKTREYFTGLVERKRARPGNDLTSRLLEHPAALSDAEVLEQLFLISSISYQPITHLIGNALRVLFTDEELANAYAGTQLSTADLLDHVMWTESPFQLLTPRFVTQDVRLGNRELREGDGLLLCIGGAHADPAIAIHSGDALFRPTVGNRAHLAWGAGPHGCPGQNVASRIASIGVQAALQRLADLRLAVPADRLHWHSSPFMRSLLGLSVEFTPGRPLERPPRARTAEPAAKAAESGEGATATSKSGDDLLTRLLKWWRGTTA